MGRHSSGSDVEMGASQRPVCLSHRRAAGSEEGRAVAMREAVLPKDRLEDLSGKELGGEVVHRRRKGGREV